MKNVFSKHCFIRLQEKVKWKNWTLAVLTTIVYTCYITYLLHYIHVTSYNMLHLHLHVTLTTYVYKL